MFRTRTAFFNPERASRAKTSHPATTAQVKSRNLRLVWTVDDGHLIGRWQREPRDLAEDGARITRRCAA